MTTNLGALVDKILSIDFLKFFIPVVGTVLAWFWNERRKRSADDYIRKEKKYEALVESLRGFYVATASRELKRRFLDELNKCWLYCPDEIIEKGYAFLATVHTDKVQPDEVKERALGELVVAIRKDLLSRRPVRRTALKSSHFKHFAVI